MSKSWLVVIWVVISASVASAGDWEKSADLGLNFSQSSYNDAWTGDEKGTVIWTLLSDLVAERSYSESTNWKNTLKLAYGKTKTEQIDASGDRSWAATEKSTDRIFMESLLKFNSTGYVNPFVALTLESQFDDGADHFLKPALWTESAGLGRTLKKTETTDLFSRVGFAYRQRAVHDRDTVTDGGLEWVTDLTHTFNERLNMVTKVRLYKAVSSSSSDDPLLSPVQQDYWKSTDLAWETKFSASISKYIQATLFFELLYDEEISTSKRYRQNLGVGVTYKLF